MGLEVRIRPVAPTSSTRKCSGFRGQQDRELAWKGLPVTHTEWMASLPKNGEIVAVSPESYSK